MVKHTPNSEHKQLIIPDHMAIRAMARNELASVEDIGIWHYLTQSQFVRHSYLSVMDNVTMLPANIVGHSVLDVINILSDSEDSLSNIWRNAYSYLQKDNSELRENIWQLKLPSWANGKLYKTAVVTDGWLFNLVYALRTPLAMRFRSAWANGIDKYPQQYHKQIIAELGRKIGWAGTRNRLEMQSIYEPGDYDNPVQPPGSPDEE